MPAGRWVHRLAGACCDDPDLACGVCACLPNAVGQVYEVTTRARGTCLPVSCLLWFLLAAVQMVGGIANALVHTAFETTCTAGSGCMLHADWNQVSVAALLGVLAALLGCIGSGVAAYFVCTSRRVLRARDGIPPGACGDCCVSYWCTCCALVQMLRHMGVTGATYRPCQMPVAV